MRVACSMCRVCTFAVSRFFVREGKQSASSLILRGQRLRALPHLQSLQPINVSRVPVGVRCGRRTNKRVHTVAPPLQIGSELPQAPGSADMRMRSCVRHRGFIELRETVTEPPNAQHHDEFKLLRELGKNPRASNNLLSAMMVVQYGNVFLWVTTMS